jgi:hypothetical protein
MCKEMPVIPVNKVVDPKRIIRTKKISCLFKWFTFVAMSQKTYICICNRRTKDRHHVLVAWLSGTASASATRDQRFKSRQGARFVGLALAAW